MKKILILFVLTVFIATLYADLMVPTGKTPLNIESFKRTIKVHTSVSREAPEYEFVTDPVNLITNFYDYMPGSYNATPVRVQPEISQPAGYPAGGIYITFHARETAYSTRRVYYAYINSNGTLFNFSTIGFDDLHEGYSGIDIDPVTGDPFVAWHVNVVLATPDLEVVGTYDLFHILGAPGLWRTPFIIIEDTTPSPNAPDDEFIWPSVHIGPSPDPDKRRVYVVGNNAYSPGTVSENVLICYADFDVDDLNNQSTLNWSYNTIPLMDQWNQGIPEWIRPFKSFDVSTIDGKVALFGYNTNDEIFVFLNENYGEGDFEFISLNYQFDVWNPQNLDGSYYFADQGVPYTLYWSFEHCGHMNSIFTDGTNKLNFNGTLGLQCYEGSYWPFWIYPKAFQYDLNTQEFSFHDLYIEGANPDDNIPMVPWDLNEDGVVDSWDPNGYVEHVHGWPIYFWDTNVAFHENNFKMASNEDNGWLVNVWQDGLKSKYYNDWGDPDYIDWAEIAEVMISISNDGGATWSEPIIMNSLVGDENYVTQFDGMHPCYFYAGDKIEDLGDNWGLVHLFFLDDYSYGSWIHGYGENIGGMMEYASIKINFGPPIIPGYIEGIVTLIGGTGNVEDVVVTAGDITVNPNYSGDYSIEIEPGIYDVTATLDGYNPETIGNVSVNAGTTTSNVNFILEPILLPPSNLQVNYLGYATWDIPGTSSSFYEDFEGIFPPNGWLKINPDGGTGWESLEIGTNPLPGWVSGEATTCPNGGNWQAYCTWVTGGATMNDQWLITPQIIVADGDNLNFYMIYYQESYDDHVEILISTTAQDDPVSFNIMVDEIDFTFGSSTCWELYSYSLTDFVLAGTPIYIAFRETVPDNFMYGSAISIDNVYVGESIERNLNTTKSQNQKINLERDFNYIHIPTVHRVNRELIGYNVYLDNTFVENTSNLSYQYTGLNAGTNYTAGVSAVYDNPPGESIIIEVDFNYNPNPVFNPPQNVTVYEETGTVSWDSPVIQDIIASRLSSEQYTQERELIGFNVYLDDMTTPVAYNIPQFEYTYPNLIWGETYTAGVSAVYTDPPGESEIIEVPFTYNPVITFDPPQNVYVDQTTGTIFWDSPISQYFSDNFDTPKYNSRERDLTGYNVYLDNMTIPIVSNISELEYTYTNLLEGYPYTAGVSAVYEEPTGESDIIEVEFTYNPGGSGPNSPQNLGAVVIDFNSVLLNWELPPGSPQWIHWDDGTNNNSIGLTAGGDFYVASRWDPVSLTNYDGCQLTKVQFFPTSAQCSYEVRVWTGANAANLVATEPVAGYIVDDWNVVDITTPVIIDATDELWFGYKIIGQPTGEFPAGCDDGPAVVGYGDMVSIDGIQWDPLAIYNLDYNWNIQGYVISSNGEYKVMRTPKVLNQNRRTSTNITSTGIDLSVISATKNNQKKAADTTLEIRSLAGYKVYRDSEEIAEITDPNTLEYTDEALDAGDYAYYVTAIYLDPSWESDPSNIAVAIITLPVPTNVEAMSQPPNIIILWDEPERGLESYNIYRNGELLEEGIYSQLYIDINVPYGNYVYNVTAVYTGGYESEFSNDAQIAHTPNPGYIEGTVTLNSGLGNIEDTEITAGVFTVNPDVNGDYSIEIVAGIYDVTASLYGYQSVIIEDIEVFENQITIVDFILQLLECPENLVAELESNNVILEWNMPEAQRGISTTQIHKENERNNVRSLTGFKVYRNGNEIADINDPSMMTYIDECLNAGDYSYYVTAIYDETDESFPSNIQYVTVVLAPPENLTLSSQIFDIFLQWEAPVFTRDLTGYKVYRNNEFIIEVEDTLYIDENMATGVYTYFVTAMYGQYESEPSNVETIEHTHSDNIYIPDITKLKNNYPNPFNPETKICFTIAQTSSFVTLEIYNIKGQKVKTLECGESLSTTAPMYRDYSIIWNGTDENNSPVASGIYFYKLSINGKTKAVRKMMLIK